MNRAPTNYLEPPAVLCSHCKNALTEIPSGVFSHQIKHEHRILSPQDMLAIQSVGKGQMLHMKGGETLFEYLVLTEIEAQYPGLFLRVNRGWLVANDMISGFIRAYPKHLLTLKDSALTVPVSRRAWPRVAEHLNLRLPLGRTTPVEYMTRMGSYIGLTHNRPAPEVTR